jgi:hypothetical protein
MEQGVIEVWHYSNYKVMIKSINEALSEYDCPALCSQLTRKFAWIEFLKFKWIQIFCTSSKAEIV